MSSTAVPSSLAKCQPSVRCFFRLSILYSIMLLLHERRPSSTQLIQPQRISSACSCLATTSSTSITSTPTPTSTLSTSTCTRSSASACPTSYSPCCAYLCAEAQVPFLICSQENQTVLAQCQKCPTTTAAPTSTPTPTSTTSSTSTTDVASSTCARTSAAACPTPATKCCAYLCGEAQVPFALCSETDITGQFASCSKCPA